MKYPCVFFNFLSLAAILLMSKNHNCSTAYQFHTSRQDRIRAAVVKVDITPEDSQNLLGYGARKSTGVHDRIYHRIVVLDDGITQIYIVSSDICEVSPSEYDLVAAKGKQELGINPMNLWWAVTHTHSAPEVGPPGLGSTFLETGLSMKSMRTILRWWKETDRRDQGSEAETRSRPARCGLGVCPGKHQSACSRG